MVYSGSITSAALTTFLHLQNNSQCLSPSTALPSTRRDVMTQDRSFGSENTGDVIGAKGVKNYDLARRNIFLELLVRSLSP